MEAGWKCEDWLKGDESVFSLAKERPPSEAVVYGSGFFIMPFPNHRAARVSAPKPLPPHETAAH